MNIKSVEEVASLSNLKAVNGQYKEEDVKQLVKQAKEDYNNLLNVAIDSEEQREKALLSQNSDVTEKNKEIDALKNQLSDKEKEIEELKSEIKNSEEVKHKSNERLAQVMMDAHSRLEEAEKEAEEIVQKAKDRSSQIIKDANNKSSSIIDDAKEKAKKELEDAKTKIKNYVEEEHRKLDEMIKSKEDAINQLQKEGLEAYENTVKNGSEKAKKLIIDAKENANKIIQQSQKDCQDFEKEFNKVKKVTNAYLYHLEEVSSIAKDLASNSSYQWLKDVTDSFSTRKKPEHSQHEKERVKTKKENLIKDKDQSIDSANSDALKQAVSSGDIDMSHIPESVMKELGLSDMLSNAVKMSDEAKSNLSKKENDSQK